MPDARTGDSWVTGVPAPDYQKQLAQQYPWTAGVGVNIVDSTAKGDPSRKLEFYAPGETDNPNPGRPTIEVFDKSMTAKDLMGEVLSHHLPKTDQNVAQYRQRIIDSMTPDQIASIRGDYENELKEGLVDKGDDLKAWLQKQGGDSFFRGLPTGQWPENEYTPQQKATYDQLNSYLTQKFGSGQAPKGLINMPAPSPQ